MSFNQPKVSLLLGTNFAGTNCFSIIFMFLEKDIPVFLKGMVPNSAYFFASASISFKNDLSLVDISSNFSKTLNIVEVFSSLNFDS